jgi:hypothetical protein
MTHLHRGACRPQHSSSPRLKDPCPRRVAATALTIGLTGLLLGSSLNAFATPAPGSEVPDTPPVAQAGDLVLRAQPQGAGYELRVGEGRVLLTLAPPTLVAPNPEAGSGFLDALSKALDVAPPIKDHTTPLQPLSFSLKDLGNEEEGGRMWRFHKASFARGGDFAEAYLNISSDGRYVVLRAKDPSNNESLVDILAEPLRDGPAPKRTKASDPNLESDEPLYAAGKPVLTPFMHSAACLPGGWLAFANVDKGYSVQWFDWGSGAKKTLCELTGTVAEIAVGSRGNSAVLLLAEGDEHGVRSSDGHSSLWRLDAQGCQRIKLPANVQLGHFENLLVSPDGTKAALVGGRQLHVIDTANGVTKSIPLDWRQGDSLLRAYAWDDSGILLWKLANGRATFARYVPGGVPVQLERLVLSSRDGQYRVSPELNALEVRSKTSTESRRLQARNRNDQRTLQRMNTEAPALLAAHGLVLRGTSDLALDLVTLKTRPVAPKNLKWYCATPDGANALFTDIGSSLYPATRRP